ncbi:MAG: ECF-type sigma factor [Planctomycetia bacterium]|nr:ECF-type sigma factor [Planctomycetia bacterium]
MGRPAATSWIDRLARGDDQAVELVFSRYFQKLVRAASRKLSGINTAIRNEEDIVMSAMKSFCLGVREKHYLFESEDDLWGFLFLLVDRKATAERRRNLSQKRGLGVCTKSGNQPEGPDEGQRLFDSVAAEDPTPEAVATMTEEVETFLNICGDNEISSQIIKMKLEGYTVPEIASALGLVPHTIFYHLKRIKRRWQLVKTCQSLTELKTLGGSDEQLAEQLGVSEEEVRFLWSALMELWSQDGASRGEDAALLNSGQGEPTTRLTWAQLRAPAGGSHRLEWLVDRWHTLIEGKWLNTLVARRDAFERAHRTRSRKEQSDSCGNGSGYNE